MFSRKKPLICHVGHRHLGRDKGPPPEGPEALRRPPHIGGGASRPEAAGGHPVAPPLEVCVVIWVVVLGVRQIALSHCAALSTPHLRPMPTTEAGIAGWLVDDHLRATRQPVGGPQFRLVPSQSHHPS